MPLLREGVKAVGRVILLAIAMDIASQVIVCRRFYPVELVVVVVLLAFLPYMVIRGVVNHIAEHFLSSRTVTHHGR